MYLILSYFRIGYMEKPENIFEMWIRCCLKCSLIDLWLNNCYNINSQNPI